jgi:division protein CdvB (Snf7/Vps24/ESCRT-III family)
LTALNKELEAMQKTLKDLTTRLEVERCMNDMLSWVSEGLINKQVVENLNKIARKVNKIGEKVYEGQPQPADDPK